jgi:hypothetical protein
VKVKIYSPSTKKNKKIYSPIFTVQKYSHALHLRANASPLELHLDLQHHSKQLQIKAIPIFKVA